MKLYHLHQSIRIFQVLKWARPPPNLGPSAGDAALNTLRKASTIGVDWPSRFTTPNEPFSREFILGFFGIFHSNAIYNALIYCFLLRKWPDSRRCNPLAKCTAAYIYVHKCVYVWEVAEIRWAISNDYLQEYARLGENIFAHCPTVVWDFVSNSSYWLESSIKAVVKRYLYEDDAIFPHNRWKV